MAGYSLETAREHLAAWLQAELKVSTGQEYRIGSRSLKRADLSMIAERITYWRKEVERLEAGRRGARVLRIVPRDL